jgi:RNA polymerase sigma-70 factor, ECF subfamily
MSSNDPAPRHDAPGGPAAMFQLMYDELHRLAVSAMSRERRNHTLQPTALLNEVFLKLIRSDNPAFRAESREQFLGQAAVAMRRILVNYATARRAEKRGQDRFQVSLDVVSPESLADDGLAEKFENRALDLLALDEALHCLARLDATQARIVELKFFGGLTNDQCAELLSLSPRTVSAEWAHARAWLRRRLQSETC